MKSLFLYPSSFPLLKTLGAVWNVAGGVLVETTVQRGMAAAKMLMVESVIVSSGSSAWSVITNPHRPDYGQSEVTSPLTKPTAKPILTESSEVGSKLLRLLDATPAPVPGAILAEDAAGPGLARAMHIIAESDSEDEAHDADAEEDEESESDPTLWEGATDNFEIGDGDWEAILRLQSGESVTDEQLQFFKEAGLVDDSGALSEFGQSWIAAMKDENREGEDVGDNTEEADEA